MDFNSNKNVEKFGKACGLVVTYFIFTTIAYFVFTLTHKFPESWTYFHMIPFTLCIILLGTFLKLLYKM